MAVLGCVPEDCIRSHRSTSQKHLFIDNVADVSPPPTRTRKQKHCVVLRQHPVPEVSRYLFTEGHSEQTAALSEHVLCRVTLQHLVLEIHISLYREPNALLQNSDTEC
ncbi:hypothetical protein Anapl_08264 [Anas platyrhynchos]|uniref:Uncharacterized protein n=1 Tax=Anas platyrhynchos TaxID=8839 RepID=R0KMH5_ANAPL|nr:hypothetical protein Anapl_08264 [Anas platyrhynchos]